MDRRRIVLGGCATVAAPQLLAQTNQEVKPYLQVTPVPGEEKTVRVFFAAMCPYSKSYLQFFRNLAKTLPSDKIFAYSPVVNIADGTPFALSFAAIELRYPQFLDAFIEASMVAAQDKGISTASWPGLERIGQAARLPVSLPKLVLDNEDSVKKKYARYIDLRADLQIINTPAVAVAGTYVVTPEFTRGDAALFSQLVNGIISMAR